MNQKLLQQLKPEQIEVDIVRVEEPEEAGIEESELDARRGAMSGVTQLEGASNEEQPSKSESPRGRCQV